MKRALYILLAALPLLASCDMKESLSGGIGTPIHFTANTYYENGLGTKTDYSGEFFGDTQRFERIDWVDGDLMHIWAEVDETHTANENYRVSSHSASQQISNAEIVASGSGINWLSQTAQHTFYAMYPSPSIHGDGEKVALARNIIKATIPATQVVSAPQNVTVNNVTRRICKPDMKYAYMWAAARADVGEDINLGFKPLMTAFEITVGAADASSEMQQASFTLAAVNNTSGPYLAGDFVATINSSSLTSYAFSLTENTSRSRSITVNLGNVAVTNSNPVTFTIFALPQTMSGLKMIFNFTGGGAKSVELKSGSQYVTFEAGKKYRIANVYVPEAETWTYKIEEIENITTYGHVATTSSLPFNVTSYKYLNGDESNKVPVAWKIEYSTDQVNWTTSNDGKIGVNLTTGGGGLTLTVNNGANVLRDHNSDEYSGDSPEDIDGATAALRSAPDIPASAKDTDGYYDLSKHPVYGSNQFGAPQNMETANCYVVQGPGLYKFPLVYGNAIRNGATNAKSYAPSVASPTGHFLSNFIRHDGSAIAGPWITTDNGITVSDAIIVWQDGTNNAAGQIIKDADVSVDGNYIKFEVKRALIRPGNVIVAARNSSGTIVWSWHIWVTEKDLAPKTVKDGLNNTLSMMNYNLGWMDATSARTTNYNTWTTYVRVSQTETGGTSRIFRVRQIGDVIHVDANVGCNTFYQWGRKDPMLPATGDNEDKAQYSANNLTWQSSRTHQITSGGFEVSIQHPNWQLVNLGGTEAYYCGSNYGNLWDAELDNGGNVGEYGNRFAVKTVYDPCPPGYVVPYEYAFSGVSKNANVLGYAQYNNGGSNSQLWATYRPTIGYKFTIPSSDVMEFPFCGARAHDGNHGGEGTSIYDVKTLGYYWTSCPNNYASTSDASGVQSRKTAKMMMMNDNVLIRPGHEQRKGAGYAVRPILQTAF